MFGTLCGRWRLVGMLALVLLALTGCGHGPMVQHGSIEVYYTEGATKEEADRLGAYLVKVWPGADRRSVQIKKTPDGYQFRMVVRKEFQHDDKALNQLVFDGARISRDVFNGAAVEMHACDEHLRTLKVLPPRADVRYGILQGKAEVFFAGNVPKAEAEKLANFLATRMVNEPAAVSFKLARRDKAMEVHMVVRDEVLNDPAVLASLRQNRNDLAVNVFPGTPVELHLCDDRFNVRQILRP
jgi:hypothetical protein